MDGTQLMEKVAEVAPDKYEFLMKTAAEISLSPFKDEILEEMDGILKKAAFNAAGMAKTVGRGALMGASGIATMAMGGIGLALAGDAYDAAKRGISKTRDYKRMLATNPDLKNKPAVMVQNIFSTLHRFNPEYASDPIVSGSFVRMHADAASNDDGVGTIGLETMKSLVDAHKGMGESRRIQGIKPSDIGLGGHGGK